MTNQLEVFQGIKGLIFDCDGTLVDSMPLHMRAWRKAFEEFNAEYDEIFLFSLKGMKEVEIIEVYNQKFNINLDPIAMVHRKHDFFRAHIGDVKPIPKVANIARHYYGKIPLAVVSGSLKKIVHTELKVTGLFKLFDFILTGDDPFKPKPAPDIFLEAAERMNVKPEFCQVFEDGDPGLESARNAGMMATDIRLFI